MNVLLVNKFFFLNGGSERVFFQERNFLLNGGVEVVDFSMKDSRNFPSPYSMFFVSKIDYQGSTGIWNKLTQGARFIYSREAVKNVERIIQEKRPDIAHLHNIYHQLTPAIIPVLKKHGVKVLLTLHDGKLICPSYLMLNKGKICTACGGQYFWMPLTKRCQSLPRCLLLTLEAYWHKWKKSYESVDLFIAPSRFLRDLIGQRVPKDRIMVLYNGTSIDDFSPSWQDEGYGLYFGRLSREKGIETLLRAYKAISDEFDLKVLGTGPLEEELRGQHREVEFLGYKEGEELKRIVSKSAFVVVPSEWYENCPMVVLEAMAMGKPVIGSRTGGLPELIDDGKTGLLFEMGNIEELGKKMKALAQDRAMRISLGKAARRKVESEYSYQKHCRGLLEIYENVLR
jgi:glycosyltransferase involved in cell wall biosynthesis